MSRAATEAPLMRHGTRYPSLGPFLEELERRVGRLTQEELREALLRHAESLRPAEREYFVDIFQRSPGRRTGNRVDDPLVADIDAFVERLRSEAYADGYGWDPDLHGERVFGDESWVWEMDDLFAGAASAFLDGDWSLAAEAYGRLLHAFLLEEEGNAFPGALTATESVETDVGEALARYLRALCESSSPPERAGRLASAVEGLWHLDRDVSLARVSTARREPLGDLQAFLPDWIERLEAVGYSDWGFGPVASRLLAEATELHGGTEALGELARRRVGVDPEVCLRWVDALIAKKDAGAEASCTEALVLLQAGAGRAAEIRSLVAERLASLGETAGDRDGVLAARAQAWRSSATLSRLVRLVEAARACGREDEILQAEAESVQATRGGRRTGSARRSAANAMLSCAVLLLCGRVDAAISRVRRAEPLGWQQSMHPGSVVVPFLLAAAGQPEAVRRTRAWGLLRARAAGSVTFGGAEDAFPRDEVFALADLLAESVERRPPSSEDRRRWLEAARKEVERRTAAVLQAKHRGAYERVARLVAACSEAIGYLEGVRLSEAFLGAVRERYSRYPAFKRELERALGTP